MFEVPRCDACHDPAEIDDVNQTMPGFIEQVNAVASDALGDDTADDLGRSFEAFLAGGDGQAAQQSGAEDRNRRVSNCTTVAGIIAGHCLEAALIDCQAVGPDAQSHCQRAVFVRSALPTVLQAMVRRHGAGGPPETGPA